MSQALQLILQTAFNRLCLHPVDANIPPGNNASITLMENAGFVR